MLKVKDKIAGKVQVEIEGRSVVLDGNTPEDVLAKVHKSYPDSFVEEVEQPKKSAPQLTGKEDKNEK
jgi:hydroxymethylglutaryl-CoA reductase